MSALDRWLREGWLRPLDHALGASLLRLTPGTPDNVALAAALASRALAFGHSRVPLDRVADLCAEIAPERTPALPDRGTWERELSESPYVARGEDDARGKPLVFASGAIALRRYDDYEAQLASALRALSGPIAPAPDADSLRERIATLFAIDASHPADRQALAAALAQIERVVLLTGGPGTGKTTTVARVLVLAVETALRRGEVLRVALAAPTGKAAARLSESLRESYAKLLDDGRIDATLRDALPSSASTLHRLLGGRPDSVHFRHDTKNPLQADLVVVDEASMVDLPLMASCERVVAACATHLARRSRSAAVGRNRRRARGALRCGRRWCRVAAAHRGAARSGDRRERRDAQRTLSARAHRARSQPAPVGRARRVRAERFDSRGRCR